MTARGAARSAPSADEMHRRQRAVQATRARQLKRGELLVDAVPGSTGAVPGVRVEGIIDCEPRRMWNLFHDYEMLPRAIFGLHSARVIAAKANGSLVEFTMKLPFPFGTIAWINWVRSSEQSGVYAVLWDYVEGDLETNTGQLVMAPFGDNGLRTYALYQVQVEARSRMPKAAQRLATRWLLPKVVAKLRRVAEEKTH